MCNATDTAWLSPYCARVARGKCFADITTEICSNPAHLAGEHKEREKGEREKEREKERQKKRERERERERRGHSCIQRPDYFCNALAAVRVSIRKEWLSKHVVPFLNGPISIVISRLHQSSNELRISSSDVVFRYENHDDFHAIIISGPRFIIYGIKSKTEKI